VNTVFSRILQHVRPCGESEIVGDILGSFRQAAATGVSPVVLFCAGSSGRILCALLARHGITPACFCDNDASKVGEVVCGVPIISFEELKNRHRESLIVIASAAYQGFVARQLLENGFNPMKILRLDAGDGAVDTIIRRERILMYARNGDPSSVLDLLQRDQERISNAFDLLWDEKSRELFVRRLALVASGYECRSYRDYIGAFSEPVLQFGFENPNRFAQCGSYFYFNNDVLHLTEGEVLLDGGAYTGDSADHFVQACSKRGIRYGHIYCFEPDPQNFEHLTETTSKYRDVTCHPYGLWSHRTRLNFVNSTRIGSYEARVQDPGDHSWTADGTHIEAVAIDDQPFDRQVSFIKLDIEGAECQALEGAGITIATHRPKLALSVYHQTSDLYEIPLRVHELHPDYRMYLRHFGNYFDDTLLLATT
jgi:FkbM family methyltransferase